MPQREPLPPPESKGGCMIQLNRLERPYSQSWPRTSSESIRTNPRMFSAMMVKKIHPFPYLELSGSEPGGGKDPPPHHGEKTHLEPHRGENSRRKISDDIIQEPGPATTDEIFTSIHLFTHSSIKRVLGIYYVPGALLSLGNTTSSQSQHIPTLRRF